MADEQRVGVRLSPEHVALLDALVEESGASRSIVVRRLLEGGTAGAPSGKRLSADELRDLLHESARQGSTAAQRFLLETERAERELERLRRLTTD